jgi:predicted MPP superfamily phosphohydrolase
MKGKTIDIILKSGMLTPTGFYGGFMTYIYVFIALIVLLLLYMRFEAGFLKVERVRLTKNKKCLKIALLSDIHIRYLKVPAKKIRKVIIEENPDLIIFTGDYIDSPRHIPKFLEFLGKLKGTAPNILICLGNHDYTAFPNDKAGLMEFQECLKSLGLKVLHSDSISIEKHSNRYNVIGIEDLKQGKPDIERVVKLCDAGAYMNIAFSHNPDIVFELPYGAIDYLLCGHFHGGQIWTPFNFEFKILRRGRLCSMGIRSGLHKVNGINLYINRGLGNVIFPLRFLSRPELTIFYLP